jgi:hypothetical protein
MRRAALKGIPQREPTTHPYHVTEGLRENILEPAERGDLQRPTLGMQSERCRSQSPWERFERADVIIVELMQ